MSMAVREPRELDELLSQVRFRPRSSLGVELLGRWTRGEGPGSLPGRSRGFLLFAIGVLAATLLILALWSALEHRRAGRSIDRCCQDLDGGGVADDGLLIETPDGSEVRRLVIYEDLDDSGSYTRFDTIRFDRVGGPSVTEYPAQDMQMFELCCHDYDGGGPRDDALVIIASPPDRIAMAAIYERRPYEGSQPLR